MVTDEDRQRVFDVANDIGGEAVVQALADYYADMAYRWAHDASMVKVCGDLQAACLRALREIWAVRG